MNANKVKPSGRYAEDEAKPGRMGDHERGGSAEDEPSRGVGEKESPDLPPGPTGQPDRPGGEGGDGRDRKAGSPVRSDPAAMASDLAERKCTPCERGSPPLKGGALADLRARVDPEWQVIDEHHLRREFKFRDFRAALEFTNRVGAIAEAENHHPDIHLSWGRVVVELWTHSIGGLSENDFILAARIDQATSA